LETLFNQAKSLDQTLAEAFEKADRLDATLDERLKLYLGESRALLSELEATYDQLVARLAANATDSQVPPWASHARFLHDGQRWPGRRPCVAAGGRVARHQLQWRAMVRLLRSRAARARPRLSP